MTDELENLSMNTPGSPPEALPAPAPAQTIAPRDIWTPRDLLLFLAFIPFALLASKLAILIAYVVVRPFAGWQVRADAAQSDTIFLLVQQCAFYLLVLGFLFLVARIVHRQPFWKSLGWTRINARQVAGYLAGGGALAVTVSLVLLVRPDTHAFPLEKLFNSRIAAFAIGAFAISLAPVIEEVVFRGLLFAVVERAMGLPIAVATTAVLFAGLHVPEYWHAWNHVLMILVVGIVFSLARGMTGSLAPSIVLHMGYNTFIVTGLFFSTQHFRAISALWARGWI